MRDRVAEVLAERVALQRGASASVLVSLALHAVLLAALGWSALRSTKPVPASMVQIQFAPMPAPAARTTAPRARRPVAEKPVPPKVEEPKPVPKIAEPKPAVEPVKTPEKNTVPLSPFGRSTKKGSETPAPAPAPPAALPPAVAPGVGTTTADVPVGGSGVTGLEGGDFPYTLYIGAMQRRVGANWFRPQIAAGATTIVYFRILRNGTITESRVTTPSGNATFDRAALSAVRSSTPLNPLPPGYVGSYLGVHLTFR
jgi:periplasmic protein TonB